MIFRFTDYLFIVLAVFFGMSFLIITGIVSDNIEVNIYNDYLEEYNLCQEELESHYCPDCVCKTSLGFIELMFGFLLGILWIIVFQNYEKIKKVFKKNKKNGTR